MTDQHPHEPHDHRSLWNDPSFLRGMTQRRVSRRDVLRTAGVGAGALSLGAILAACGVSGTKNAQTNTDIGTEGWWDQQAETKEVVFANWPLYIDGEKGDYPSLAKFTQDTGIAVTYKTKINDNPGFYAQIAPILKSGQPIGYDIVVLTNNSPVLSKVINTNGWAIALDHRKMPNFTANAAPEITDPWWDPGNKYTMAWQSGLTAIGYNPKYITKPVTSVESLFDPDFSGHIGMFSDPQELGTLGLLAIGVDPAKSTPTDWQKAADKLKTQTPLVRSYGDQGYIDALANGDLWITQAWSGDIFQENKSVGGGLNLQMVVPSEGGMLWTDNMLIPLYAANPVAAMKVMDYYYTPEAAGMVADAVTYITPCPACQDYIKNTLNDPKAAESPLIFPDAAMTSKFKAYYQYKDQSELDTWNEIFEPIVNQ
jgi:spermidine/putrescine transport system substrate-binding protein